MQENKTSYRLASRLFSHRWFLALVSILAAFLLWVVYTNNYGATETRTFTGVEVNYSGESALRDSLGLVVTYEDNDYVTVTISGPRRYIMKLTATDLTATVDLSRITRNGDKTLNYTIDYPSSVDSTSMTTTKKSPEYITLTVSKLSTKTVDVKGTFIGTTMDGYVVDSDIQFEPSTVTVTGPAEELEKIVCAHCVIDRENVKTSMSLTSNFRLQNAEGEDVELSDNIQCDVDTVNANLTVNMLKKVSLDVTLIEGGGATADHVIKSIQPEYIMLAGDSATLDGVNSISVATIDLSDYTSFPETEYSITLPNDTYSLSGETTALVNLEFSGLESSLFTVYNLSYTNCPEGYYASIMPTSIVVTVRAPAETLAQIESNNLRAVADLTDVTSTSRVPVTVYVDGFTDAGAVGDYTMAVSMTEISE